MKIEKNMRRTQEKFEYTKGVIREEQTTQLPKEKGQHDKQQSTKHTYKAKDRVTRTPLKRGMFLHLLLEVQLNYF